MLSPQNAIRKFLEQFLNISIYRKNSKKHLKHQFAKYSFSQYGEDIIIENIFALRKISHPSYIDLGANHPFLLSNTALFYLKGCRGINVEANPYLVDDFLKYRSEDINLNYGINVNNEDTLDFYIINDSTLSSFSKAEAENYTKAEQYHIQEIKQIKTFTLEYILELFNNNKCPDFLSIDVEGIDFEVIKTIDFNKYKFKVICVESFDYSPIGAGKKRNDLVEYIQGQKYYEYANTGLNSIFVREDFWFI